MVRLVLAATEHQSRTQGHQRNAHCEAHADVDTRAWQRTVVLGGVTALVVVTLVAGAGVVLVASFSVTTVTVAVVTFAGLTVIARCFVITTF